MSRGLKNCNPGNIRQSATRYKGEVVPSRDPAFKQFETMAWGYRAMFVLLDAYRRKGFSTLRAMIMRYAPPVENHTENYISWVARQAGIDPDAPVDMTDQTTMQRIVAAMSHFENGVPPCSDEVSAGWSLFQP